MKTFTLGIQGMIEMPNDTGKYVETSYHVSEMLAWEKLSQKNRVFAEGLLKQQDDEIANKNKIIVTLHKQINGQEDDQANHQSTVRKIPKIPPG